MAHTTKRSKKKVPKRLRKKVSRKIRKLRGEGKPSDQAVAQGINQVVSEDRKKR
jgi:hypothetical protein